MKKILPALAMLITVGCGTADDLEVKTGAYTRTANGVLYTSTGEQLQLSGAFTACTGTAYLDPQVTQKRVFAGGSAIDEDRMLVGPLSRQASPSRGVSLDCYNWSPSPAPGGTANSIGMDTTLAYGNPVLYNGVRSGWQTVCDVYMRRPNESAFLLQGKADISPGNYQYVVPNVGSPDQWQITWTNRSNTAWCPGVTMSAVIHTTTIAPR